MTYQRILILWFAFMAAASTPARSQSFSGCANNLDDLRRRADELRSRSDDLRRQSDDATDEAKRAKSADEELQSKKNDFDSAKNDYERCRRLPEIYDLLRDGCAARDRRVRSAKSDLDSAQSDRDAAVSRLQNALNDVAVAMQDTDSATKEVAIAMKDVEQSCGMRTEPKKPIPGVSPAYQRMCTTVQNARRTLGTETALSLCKMYAPETECKACLSAPPQ